MSSNTASKVIIETTDTDLRQKVEEIMDVLAPKTFDGATVLIKPNMVGPSVPELGHTTHPELVQAVVRACLDRRAKVIVGDNPGGISRNASNVASVTGILDASEGCFNPISERVVEKAGGETGFQMILSRPILEADYVINLPIFKTHVGQIVTGAIKNTFGYIAGACKAHLHLVSGNNTVFASAICDVYQVRPPDLNIMDAITVLEGNGPCHGGQARKVGKIMASNDALALDAVMVRMMGVDPSELPVQIEAKKRGFGKLGESEIDIQGPFEVIPHFKMPSTYKGRLKQEDKAERKVLYAGNMMADRVSSKPTYHEERCIRCGDCVENCPAGALTLEPEFNISDKCIVCFCCVELCTEGALEVPDIAAFKSY